jgi:TolB protein
VNSSPIGLARNSILIANPDGSASSMLFEHPTLSALAPVWSPRADRLAFGLGRFFSMIRGFAPARVVIMDAATRELTMLTDGEHNDGFPSWAPGGERIVYRRWGADGSSLRIKHLATGTDTLLLEKFGRANFPAWSPDGREILFTSDESGDYELYTVDPQTRRVTRLTRSRGTDGHGSWSPDGEWIAFSSVRGGYKDEAAVNPGNPQASGDIYVMRRDGSDVHALTDNAFEEGSPGWVPSAH